MSFNYAVYFAEPDRNRVIRWDPDAGTADVVAGEPPISDPSQTLRKPYGIAIDPVGRLLVADKFNHRIVRLESGRLVELAVRDADGHRDLRPDSRPSYRPGPPASPTGLFAEPDGSILAAYFNDHTVYRIGTDGTLELVLGITPAKAYHFTAVCEYFPPEEVAGASIHQPAGVLGRADGTVYLIERGHQAVREYHPASGLRSVFPIARRPEWRSRTEMPDEVPLSEYHPAYPGALAVDAQGTLYVAEVYHRCVLAVDKEAGTVRKVMDSRRTRKMGGISALGFGPDGTAWVADAGGGVVEAYQPSASGPWKALGIALGDIRGEPLRLSTGGGSVVTGP